MSAAEGGCLHPDTHIATLNEPVYEESIFDDQPDVSQPAKLSVVATFTRSRPSMSFQLPLSHMNGPAVIEEISIHGVDNIRMANYAIHMEVGESSVLRPFNFANGLKNNNLVSRQLYPLILGNGLLFGLNSTDTSESLSLLSVNVNQIRKECSPLPADNTLSAPYVVPKTYARTFETALVKNDICNPGDITNGMNPAYTYERSPENYFVIDGDLFNEILMAYQKKQSKLAKLSVDRQTNVTVVLKCLSDSDDLETSTLNFQFRIKFNRTGNEHMLKMNSMGDGEF